MSYDTTLAERARSALGDRVSVNERKMFGGLSFLVGGNMCCGVVSTDLVVRVGAKDYRDALKQPHAREMDFTGRPLKGFVYVNKRHLHSDETLQRWLSRALRFALSLPAKQTVTRAWRQVRVAKRSQS